MLGTLHITVQHLRDLQDAIPLYWPASASRPTILREAEDFPKSSEHPKDVPLPTFLP